ncbi:ACP S-malonyltransferase [Alkaliphilus oremlandii]|uniref:Malonyl CoA-acyl carrier protein transacylase n=1 Tax=Alkaliphilus oremlandii (strain OhILAs) TaxID=350688 RepID=A8MHB1_ALKOO|nr:ACP S-malonyltransferase [Alkaliphilus oremlandii]ABW18998.1 malonyl CoA-acyl carrier protein transacylase [Alkaliphilus oremlandii OhILAs]
MKNVAFVFPGQGAQYVGMGKDFVEHFRISKEIFLESSDAIHLDVEKLCFEGPENELMKTENTQPAILTTSVAILKVLESEGFDCSMTAGLSLGEYTSLVKSNVITFKDAVQLVKKRGKYMQDEVPEGVGTMAAILGLDREPLESCLEKAKINGIVEIANYNSPGQIVISGEVKAVEMAVDLAREAGAKKAVILPVSAPFHCSLLKGAGVKLKKDLELLKINDPQVPVVTNVEAKILTSRFKVIPSLVEQISKSVLWEDSISMMINEGIENFIEIGPGKALGSFIKKIAKIKGKKVNAFSIEDVQGFKELIKTEMGV